MLFGHRSQLLDLLSNVHRTEEKIDKFQWFFGITDSFVWGLAIWFLVMHEFD